MYWCLKVCLTSFCLFLISPLPLICEDLLLARSHCRMHHIYASIKYIQTGQPSYPSASFHIVKTREVFDCMQSQYHLIYTSSKRERLLANVIYLCYLLYKYCVSQEYHHKLCTLYVSMCIAASRHGRESNGILLVSDTLSLLIYRCGTTSVRFQKVHLKTIAMWSLSNSL